MAHFTMYLSLPDQLLWRRRHRKLGRLDQEHALSPRQGNAQLEFQALARHPALPKPAAFSFPESVSDWHLLAPHHSGSAFMPLVRPVCLCPPRRLLVTAAASKEEPPHSCDSSSLHPQGPCLPERSRLVVLGLEPHHCCV